MKQKTDRVPHAVHAAGGSCGDQVQQLCDRVSDFLWKDHVSCVLHTARFPSITLEKMSKKNNTNLVARVEIGKNK